MRHTMTARGGVLAGMGLLGVAFLLSTSPSGPAGADAPASQQAESPGEPSDRQSLDRFERCGLPAAGERPASNVEILLHAEAPARTPAKELHSRSARAAREELARVVDHADADELSCEEIEAPEGDVDYEVRVTFDADADATGPEVAVVDVQKRNLLARVAYSSGTDRCMTNVMGQTSCAAAPNGVAVQSTLGRIVCARGQCAQERRSIWRCSRAAGGWAELGHDGVRCQQGCYSPTSGQCRKL